MKKDVATLITETRFWQLIEESHGGRNLEEVLGRCPVEELMGFRYWWEYFGRLSYRQDLWAVAYVVLGGCNDDGFDNFRFWLMARGRDIFYAALENADSLCDVFGRLSNPAGSEYPQQEELDYAVMNVLEEVYGKDFDEEAARYEWPADVLPHLDFQWEEDDEESIHRVCPRTFDRWWGDDTF